MGLGKGLALSAIVVARVTEAGLEAPARPSPLTRNLAFAERILARASSLEEAFLARRFCWVSATPWRVGG